MWRFFLYAVLRKWAYLVAAAVFVFIFGHHAKADCVGTPFYSLSDSGSGCSGTSSSSGAAAAAAISSCQAAYFATLAPSCDDDTGSVTVTADSHTVGGTWTVVTSFTPGGHGGMYGCGSSGGGTYVLTIPQATGGQCPSGPCASTTEMDIVDAVAGNTGGAVGLLCVGGCGYTSGANTLLIGGATSRLNGRASPTLQSCGSSPQSPGQTGSCMAAGGVSACAGPSAASANINGDVIQAPTVAPTDPNPPPCTLFATGDVACVKPASGAPAGAPKNPDGTPAVPQIAVTDSAGTINWYSAAQAAASPTAIVAQPSGSPSTAPKTAGSGAGAAGIGSGAGTSAPCPPGQDCSLTDATSGGLTCDSPPTCTDTDPVQCGIQNQNWLIRCQSVTEGAIAAGISTMGGSLPTAGSTTTDFSNVLSESSAGIFGSFAGGGGSECPAPVTFTIQGHTVTMDLFHGLCLFAGYIGVAVTIGAYLIAAKIMFTPGHGIL